MNVAETRVRLRRRTIVFVGLAAVFIHHRQHRATILRRRHGRARHSYSPHAARLRGWPFRVLQDHVHQRPTRSDGHRVVDGLSVCQHAFDGAPVRSELTKTPISKTADDVPNHWVVRLTDDALFQCPFTMASDVGTIGLSLEEVIHLREYVLKGGFLWVDDFWGGAAWAQWSSEIGRVLPPSEYPIVDLPMDHPVFHT